MSDRTKQEPQGGMAVKRGPRHKLAAALVIAALLFPPRPAAAQLCEPFIAPIIAVGVYLVAQEVAIAAILSPPDGALPTALEAITDEAQRILMGGEIVTLDLPTSIYDIPVIGDIFEDTIGEIPGLGDILGGIPIGAPDLRFGGLRYMDEQMLGRLDKFWDDLLKGLQEMTAQIYSSDINNARMLSSFNDSTGLSSGALAHDDKEIDAKLQNIVSDETCQFDTAAQSLGPAMQVATAVGSAYAGEIGTASANEKGTPAANGAAGLNDQRYRKYVTTLCDPKMNGGASPCAGETDSPLANAAVLPAKTLFSRETIDMKDPEVIDAVKELTMNITGYQAPAPVPRKALNTPAGREMLRKNREYATQMDAVQALVTGIAADRAPGTVQPVNADGSPSNAGQLAGAVQQMRQKSGATDASPTPSAREIRESVVEQVKNPNFFVNLGDGGGTIDQKQVYLKAYEAMMMNKLIEQQEKIANAYAIEAGNMLKKYRRKRDSRAGSDPFK